MTSAAGGPRTTRRDFVRVGLGAGLGGAAVALAGCLQRDSARTPGAASERASGEGGADGTGGAVGRGDAQPVLVTRPVLRRWADEIVWLATESGALPVAYVSMELRRVFVDRAHRDRAAWLLDAHISVSTAHWRIPLPGDPEGEPITPGDASREFEERSIRDWDPALSPSMDDIRIQQGTPERRRVEFRCLPLPGPGEAWCTAGPWEITIARGSSASTTREDFRLIGTGTRHAERSCAGPGEVVQFVGWSAPLA